MVGALLLSVLLTMGGGTYDSDAFRDYASFILKQQHLYSPESVELILGTVACETGFRKKHFKGGCTQIERKTFAALKRKYPDRLGGISYAYLTDHPGAAITAAALKYESVNRPIPSALADQGRFYKEKYNTSAGAGSAKGFIAAYKRFVKRRK